MNLAAASQMDLAEASDMVTDYLSAFGMEASEAGKMADMMAHAQANSNTSTTQLGEAFGNCAANMNAAGQDMKTTTSFLEAFANQGIKGSEAGTKLSAIMRDITAKMQDGKIQIGDTAVAVTDANGSFRDLTDIMMDVEAATDGMGTAERSAALSTTFTSRSVGGLNMILAEGVEKIAGYETQLESCDGAASTMATTMQDNLQGKLTAFNSATEGLGIAVYDYFSGPLKGAVDLATSAISGITDMITPEQTALDKFIESTKTANAEAKAAIDNANATMDKGEADVARLTAMSDTIKEANKQFGLFAETDTSAVSDDMESTASGVSKSATSIEKSAQTVIDAMNMDSVDTSGASDDLSTTEGSISTSAANIEKDAKKAVTGLNKVGDADTSGAASDLSETAESIGESAEGIGTDADTVKTKLEGIGQADISGENLKTELQGIQTEASNTAESMDEFTKFKVKAAVMDLAQSIPAIGEAWDDVTGTLRMTEQEFDNLVNAQKRAIMETSLAKAQAEAMEAVAQATIAQTMAQDGLNAIYDEANKLLDEYDGSTKHSIGSMEELKAASDEYLVLGDVWENATDAVDEYNTASENLEQANEVQERTASAAKEVARQWGFVKKEADGLAESTDGASESLDGLAESEEAAAMSAEDAQARIKAAHEQTADAITDAYESAKESAEKAFEVNPFDAWEVNAENGIGKFQEALDSQIAGITDYAENLDVVRANLGKTSPELLGYIEDMGTEGAQLVKELADAFDPKNGDPEKAKTLIDSYTKYLDAKGTISTVLAADKVAIESGLRELGSTDVEFDALGAAIEQAFTDMGADMAGSVSETLEQAKELGVKIPEGLQEGIESGKISPDQLLSELRSAMSGQLESLADVARECGAEVPENLTDGIREGTADPVAAFNELLSGINGADIDVSDMTAAVSEGMTTAVQDAAASAEQAAANSANAGETLATETQTGIETKAGEVSGAAEKMATDAASSAKDQTSAWQDAGAESAAAYAAGILSGATTAASNAAAMVQTALTTANGQTGGFYSVGQNIANGVATGIQSKVQAVANQAAQMVRAAMNAAKAEANIASPSKKFRDQVGKFIGLGVAEGIKITTADTAKAAEAHIGAALLKMRNWLNDKHAGTEAIAYTWQKLASKEIREHFGISSTTKDKKGNTAKKDAESYYGEVLTAAKQYMSNLQILYDVSDEEELAYWQKVAGKLQKGTQAWYTAKQTIKGLKESIKKDAEEAEEEEREYLEEMQELADEAEELRKKEAEERAKTTGSFSVASDMLETYQIYNELSEKDIIDYWDMVRKQYAEGTADRIAADRQYFAAKRAYDKRLTDEEKSYAEKSAEISQSLADERLEIEQDLADGIAEANEDLAKTLQDLADDLSDNLKDLEDDLAKGIEDLNKSYDKAVDDRYNSIMGAFGMFEAFESKSSTGAQLLFNMQSQAAGYKDWSRTLDQLRSRGILSDKLMEELTEKGPKETAAIHALLSLTDEELRKYNEAYETKTELARAQATKDMEGFKAQVSADIEKLKAENARKVDEAKAEYAKKADEAKAANEAKLEELRTTASKKIADAEKTASDKLTALNKDHGEKLDALNGTVNGVKTSVTTGLTTLGTVLKSVTESKAAEIAAAVGQIDAKGPIAAAAQMVSTAIENALHGGGGTAAPAAQASSGSSGIDRQVNSINHEIDVLEGQAAEARARRAPAGEVQAIERRLTELRAERDRLNRLRSSSGHRAGTRSVGRSGFDWIHENELWIDAHGGMAVPFVSGDTVVPANLTDNLFKWGAIDPASVASGAAMNRMLSGGYAPGRQAQQDTRILEQMMGILAEMLPSVQARQNLILDTGQLVGGTADGMSGEFAMRQRRQRL